MKTINAIKEAYESQFEIAICGFDLERNHILIIGKVNVCVVYVIDLY